MDEVTIPRRLSIKVIPHSCFSQSEDLSTFALPHLAGDEKTIREQLEIDSGPQDTSGDVYME